MHLNVSSAPRIVFTWQTWCSVILSRKIQLYLHSMDHSMRKLYGERKTPPSSIYGMNFFYSNVDQRVKFGIHYEYNEINAWSNFRYWMITNSWIYTFKHMFNMYCSYLSLDKLGIKMTMSTATVLYNALHLSAGIAKIT